jgi:hypothetical protein
VWKSRAHLPLRLPGALSRGERPTRREEEAVLVTYRLPAGLEPSLAADVPALEDCVERALEGRHAGELEGVQPGPGTLTVLAYGSDAERLWASIEPAVRTFPCRPAQVTLRYGLVGAPDRTLAL